MTHTLSAHLIYEFDSDWQSRFRSSLNPEIKLTIGQELPESPDYKILIGGRPTAEHFRASPECKTLIIPFAGVPAKTGELMRKLPHIAVHNLHHNAAPTAELAISLLIAAAKRIVSTDISFRKNDWRTGEASEEILLEGRTALILGYGAIGKRIARVCLSFGMNVVALRSRTGEASEGDVLVAGIDQLDARLPQANVVLISLPLTKETDGLLSARRLGLLPDNAILVNTARGPVVDEKALFTALKSERLRAGLDVWYQYPKNEAEHADCRPSKYPFGELRNVVMTPHIGGNSDRTEDLRIEHLAQLLNAAVRGEPLPNRVDIQRGY
jgi:phosphoglycerate dehydrogenase-like enzyme